MALYDFTASNGTLATTYSSNLAVASGNSDGFVIQSNACQLNTGFSADTLQTTYNVGPNADCSVFFKPGDWTDGTRRLYIQDTGSGGYEARISSTWVSLYKNNSVQQFQVSHGLSTTNGITVRLKHDTGDVIRVYAAEGDTFPTTQITSFTDGSALGAGKLKVQLGIGANTRDQYAFDNLNDAASGGGGSASAPTLTDVDTDEILSANQTSAPFSGNNLDAVTIYLVQGSTQVAQDLITASTSGGAFNVTGFSAGGLLFYGASTHVKAISSAGTAVFALATASGQLSPLSPPAGRSWVTIGTPDSSAAYRLEGLSADLVSGGQVEYENQGSSIYVSSNGVVEGTSAGITYIYARYNDGTGWSDWVSVSIQPVGSPIFFTASASEDGLLLTGASASFSLLERARQLGKLVVGPRYGLRRRSRYVYVARPLTSA